MRGVNPAIATPLAPSADSVSGAMLTSVHHRRHRPKGEKQTEANPHIARGQTKRPLPEFARQDPRAHRDERVNKTHDREMRHVRVGERVVCREKQFVDQIATRGSRSDNYGCLVCKPGSYEKRKANGSANHGDADDPERSDIRFGFFHLAIATAPASGRPSRATVGYGATRVAVSAPRSLPA